MAILSAYSWLRTQATPGRPVEPRGKLGTRSAARKPSALFTTLWLKSSMGKVASDLLSNSAPDSSAVPKLRGTGNYVLRALWLHALQNIAVHAL